MDKSECFAIFSPSYLFGGMNGNRNCCESRFNQRVINRIFSFFRVYRWLVLWLSVVISSDALAEWDNNDSDTLNEIYYQVKSIDNSLDTQYDHLDILLTSLDGSDVGDNVENINDYMYRLYNALGYSYGSSARHLSQDMADVNENLVDIHDNITGLYDGLTTLESIYARLGEILDALDNNGTGSGGETPEIPTDIATETTLSAFKGQYEQLANQFLNSWGFTQEHNLKSYFDNFFTPRYYTWTTRVFTQPAGTSEGPMTPFPIKTPVAPGYKWFNTSPGSSTSTQSFNNVFEWLQYAQDEMHGRYFLYTQSLFKKQAWNDWYAHTNLISTLQYLYQQPHNYIDKSTDIGSVNDETGEMVISYNDSDEGGSPPTPETIYTKIVFTNDFAQLETDADDIDETLDDINYAKMKDIYKVPEGIENQGYRDYSSAETIPDYSIKYGTEDSHTFVFGAKHRQMYNSLLSPALLSKLRAVFAKLWFFLSIYSNFVLFKIFGKVKE